MPSSCHRARATCAIPSSSTLSIASSPAGRPSGCLVGRRWRVLVEHAADAAHQALERGAVELVGTAEAVHHAGLDIAFPGIADVLGERQVAHHRAVLVPPLRGPQVHAHAIRVYLDFGKPIVSIRVPTCFGVKTTLPAPTNPRASTTHPRRKGLNMPNGRKPEPVDDRVLEALLYAGIGNRQGCRRKSEPDWTQVHRELRRPGVTLMLLWEEYCTAEPGGYGCCAAIRMARARQSGWESPVS